MRVLATDTVHEWAHGKGHAMVERKNLYVLDYGYKHRITFEQTFAELEAALAEVVLIVECGGFGRVTRETHLVINGVVSPHKVEETIIVRFGK